MNYVHVPYTPLISITIELLITDVGARISVLKVEENNNRVVSDHYLRQGDIPSYHL